MDKMSLLKYAKVVSRPSDTSTSSETGKSSTDGHRYSTSDDVDSTEEFELSPPKRSKTVSDCKLSASKIDAILTAEIPDIGLFSIVKVHRSAVTHDRLKEKLMKFVPS